MWRLATTLGKYSAAKLGVIATLGVHPPKNVALGYDVGKIQRRLSSIFIEA